MAFDNVSEEWNLPKEEDDSDFGNQGMMTCLHCGEFDFPHLQIKPGENFYWSCRSMYKDESDG